MSDKTKYCDQCEYFCEGDRCNDAIKKNIIHKKNPVTKEIKMFSGPESKELCKNINRNGRCKNFSHKKETYSSYLFRGDSEEEATFCEECDNLNCFGDRIWYNCHCYKNTTIEGSGNCRDVNSDGKCKDFTPIQYTHSPDEYDGNGNLIKEVK